jgi:HlyD family secretion protein
MKKTKKLIAAVIIAVLATGGIIWTIAKPPGIECIALETNTLENTFNEVGEVVPLSESDYYTKFGGKLLDVKVSEGAPVQKGDLLFVFDGSALSGEISSLEVQRSSFESEIAAMRMQAEQARLEEEKTKEHHESAKMLYEQGGISRQDLNNAKTAYELAVKNREMIANLLGNLSSQTSMVSGQIGNLKSDQSEIEVFANQDGVVRDLIVKDGYILSPGTKLCSVYQPDQYKVDCYILVENIEGVNVGDEVEITLRLRNEDKVFKGTVSQRDLNAVDRVSKVGLSEKRIKVEIALDEDGRQSVGPYWPVEIRFVSAKSKDCLIAPKTALFEDTEDVFKVWVIRAGKAAPVIVEKGVQTPSQVEIKGDLEPGDIIIKNAKMSHITEGQRVRAVL